MFVKLRLLYLNFRFHFLKGISRFHGPPRSFVNSKVRLNVRCWNLIIARLKMYWFPTVRSFLLLLGEPKEKEKKRKRKCDIAYPPRNYRSPLSLSLPLPCGRCAAHSSQRGHPKERKRAQLLHVTY